jgi:hypothetical protein
VRATTSTSKVSKNSICLLSLSLNKDTLLTLDGPLEFNIPKYERMAPYSLNKTTLFSHYTDLATKLSLSELTVEYPLFQARLFAAPEAEVTEFISSFTTSGHAQLDASPAPSHHNQPPKFPTLLGGERIKLKVHCYFLYAGKLDVYRVFRYDNALYTL